MTTPRSRAETVIAWAAWAGMSVAALVFVAHYASNVPSWDDWDMIPTLTHYQPVTWNWLWSQHNEHRVPLPRLVFLGLNRLFGVDMRVTMYFDVLATAALAAALMIAAARLRGRTRASDGFFPLALLSLGQAANFLWGWQLQFFASVIIAGIALLAIVRAGSTVSFRSAGAIVGLCALLLPLCGANGLGMVPALAAWPLALALLPESWVHSGSARRSGALMLLGGGALALTAFYFVGWQRVPYHPRSEGAPQTLLTAAKFLTIGFGPAIRSVWPLSGASALLVLGFSVLRLGDVWRTEPAERARALGLLCFIGALTALAIGLGLGRNGFETRYVTLAVPIWCAVYFVWLLYPGPNRPPAGALLALASLAGVWGNTTFGVQYAAELRGQLGAFERDLSAGVPLHELLHRYGPWLHPHQDMPERYLPMLQHAGVGRYVALRRDTTLRVVPIDLRPVETTQLVWSDSMARVQGPNPAVLFRLPSDRFVEGIRLRYRYRSDDGTLPYIGIRWKPNAQARFVPERFYKYSPTGDRANWERGTWDTIGDSATTLTLWVGDTVREIGLTPDFRPATFHIDELSLVVRSR